MNKEKKNERRTKYEKITQKKKNRKIEKQENAKENKKIRKLDNRRKINLLNKRNGIREKCYCEIENVYLERLGDFYKLDISFKVVLFLQHYPTYLLFCHLKCLNFNI